MFDIKSVCEPVTARWKSLGLALRLSPTRLDVIEKENRSLDECLAEALVLWLNKNYDTVKFGNPTWELLAKAVSHPAGGNNPALSEEIIGNHGGTDRGKLV